MCLHLLGLAQAEDRQAVGEHLTGRSSEQQTGVRHVVRLALDAAGVVEAVERAGEPHEIAVDIARVVVAGGHADLLAEVGKLLDERALLLAGEQGQVGLVRGGNAAALIRHRLEQAADTRIGVLDIVDGVLAVLAHGEAEVKFHLRVRLGVEEVAAGVDGNFIEQVREMVLPVRLDIRTTSPSRTSLTSCISTMSRRFVPSRPSASIAPFMRAT